MAPASEAVAKRTHPLTGIVQGVIFAGGAAAGLLSSLTDGEGWGDVPLWASAVVALVGGAAIGIAVGYWIWWRTRYVIDASEVRVESGLIWRNSRRVPFERIQSIDIAEPLLARVFGLAELRIDSAGGSDARTTLKFLQLQECRALRGLLLDRAHGIERWGYPLHEVLGGESPDAEASGVVAMVSPGRLVIGTVLTLDFVAALVGTIGILTAALVLGKFLAFLVAIVPLTSWLMQIVATRVFAQWDFRLLKTPTGLRIERGLLSRTSQSIPFDRVQGIAVHEPFIWRRLGWQWLEIDVAGYAARTGQQNDATSTSMLLPIADPLLARAVADELIPAVDVAALGHLPASPRSWPFAPIGWRYRWVAADQAAFVARAGWVTAKTSIVPHARTQSVELTQGPLQRRLGVATVEVHTPDGPVNADGKHLDAALAREIAFDQLARARAAR
jgi:putative membrane protein